MMSHSWSFKRFSGEQAYIYDNCKAMISGGAIHSVSGYGANTITVRNKSKIETLHSYGTTKVSVDSNDASIETIRYFTRCGCVDQSQKVNLELSGGRFGNIGTGSTEVALHIVGYNLSKSAYGGDYGYGVVKGRWRDGTDFSFNLLDTSTFSHTDLHNVETTSNK